MGQASSQGKVSSGVPICACQWHTAVALIRFHQYYVIVAISTNFECICRSSHEQPIDAVEHITGNVACLVGVRFQPTQPVSAREYVVFAHALHIAYLEAARLGCLQCTTNRYQLTIGKHISIGEAGPMSYL